MYKCIYSTKMKKKPRPIGRGFSDFRNSNLSSVKLNNLLLLEELGEIFSLWKSDQLAFEVLHIGFHVSGNLSGFVVVILRNVSARLSVSNFNNVADLNLEGTDIDQLAVYEDVAMADHLSSLENCLCVAQAPNGGTESHFKQTKEVKAGVAIHSLCLFEGVGELLFQHVVVPSNDLLCKQLFAVLRPSVVILHVGAVLTSRVCAFRRRALWPSPNVEADRSANVCFSSSISRHDKNFTRKPANYK